MESVGLQHGGCPSADNSFQVNGGRLPGTTAVAYASTLVGPVGPPVGPRGPAPVVIGGSLQQNGCIPNPQAYMIQPLSDAGYSGGASDAVYHSGLQQQQQPKLFLPPPPPSIHDDCGLPPPAYSDRCATFLTCSYLHGE